MTCALALAAACAAGIASALLWRRTQAWWRDRHFDHLDWD